MSLLLLKKKCTNFRLKLSAHRLEANVGIALMKIANVLSGNIDEIRPRVEELTQALNVANGASIASV